MIIFPHIWINHILYQRIASKHHNIFLSLVWWLAPNSFGALIGIVVSRQRFTRFKRWGITRWRCITRRRYIWGSWIRLENEASLIGWSWVLLDSGALLIARLLVCFEASLSLPFFLCFLFIETLQKGSFAFELSGMAVLLVNFCDCSLILRLGLGVTY